MAPLFTSCRWRRSPARACRASEARIDPGRRERAPSDASRRASYCPKTFVIIAKRNTKATRLVGITTIQNALFLQNGLIAGARLLPANVLIPRPPGTCYVTLTLTEVRDTSFALGETISDKETAQKGRNSNDSRWERK